MKKKLIILLLLCGSTFTSFSQITKGYWMLGGDANFYYTNFKDDFGTQPSSLSVNINPNIGYFIKDQLAIGSSTTIQFGKQWAGWFLSFSPFLRYYFLNNENTLNYFTEVSFTYDARYYKNNQNTIGYSYAIKPGIAYFLNDTVALELSLLFSHGKIPNRDNLISNSIIMNLGLQIHLLKN